MDLKRMTYLGFNRVEIGDDCCCFSPSLNATLKLCGVKVQNFNMECLF